jgi:hypothetical protein
MKKIILISIIFISLSAPKVFAATITLAPSKNTVGLEEQFYVDVLLDPQNISINGIEGSVTFPENNVSFVRGETGKSLVNFWIAEPKLDKNTISFAGIIPTGFAGVIDPFNPAQKMPGLMVRLVFAGKQPGVGTFSSAPFSLTLNDGKGTALNTFGASTSVNIQNTANPFVYKNPNDLGPKLEASIVRDPNLFDNKYALIFQATDSETGIKDVMIKEGNRDWEKIASPYLLEDQSRRSLIALEAVNFSGASIIITINPLPYKIFSASNIALFIILIVLIFFISRKIYLYLKRKNTT